MRIGVFDSGVGGLSVAGAIEKAFPNDDVDFVNDAEHVPYGDKTPTEMVDLAMRVLQPLSERCDVIVIACNTLTTNGIGELRERLKVPLVGIEPMVKPAAEQTKTNVIAVCATPATLKSKRYAELKQTYASDVKVLEPDCSKWALMIESNALEHEAITDLINDVCKQGADVIVLGCTHYHWIEELISELAAGRAIVIQPEYAIVKQLGRVMTDIKKPETYKTSKYKDKLWFKEQPQDASYFEHDFGDYRLEARTLYNQNHDKPWVLSIHGARADFTKSDAVSIGLQKRGYSLLGMNLSGHSEAGSLTPEETTLVSNIAEAEAFFDYLDHNRQKVVVAYSLGGTPGLKLLEKHADEIDVLVLFYPGIYTRESYDKHFGPEFRETISKPYSYRDNDTIALLSEFKGRLLLIKGQYDGLEPVEYGKLAGGSAGEVVINGETYYSPIPKEVIDMVYDAIPNDRRQIIEIPNCGHSVVLWMREYPREAAQLLDKIEAFLEN